MRKDYLKEFFTLKHEAIKDIKKYLLTNKIENLTSKDINYSITYVDGDGYFEGSMCESVEVENGMLFINLTDGMSIYEDDITVNNVITVLSIISELNQKP